MTIDKQQLRELASKATPGPWLHHEEHGFPFVLGPDDELLGGPVTVVDGSENLSSEDSAYIAAASPSTVLALLDEIAEVLAERDAMQSMLTQATRERDEARRNYQFMVDRAADEKLDGYRELGERAAKAENERDAVIARAETILGDRDLGIRRIAELTARAEKAERDPDPRLACLAADLRNALAELRDRRAADLTDEERDALAWAREQIRSSHWPPRGDTRRAMEAIVTIDKLIGGKS